MAKKTTLKKTQIELMVLVGLILGELVFCGVLASGILKGDQKEKVTGLIGQVTAGQRTLSLEAKIRKDFSAGYSKLEKLAAFVPKASDPYAWTYEYISMRARRAGISLQEIKEVEFKKEESAKEDDENLVYQIRLNMNCSYSKTINFLRQLEEDNPLLLVAQLEINANAASPQAHSTQMLLQWPLDFVIERGGE